MQVVREHKIEYRGTSAHSAGGKIFTLWFLLSGGVLEREGMAGFRLGKDEAVMLERDTGYLLRAEDAIRVDFSMKELRALPLSDEDRASMLSLMKLDDSNAPVLLYFRNLREGFTRRAMELLEESEGQKLFKEPIMYYELASLLLRLTRYSWRVVAVREDGDPECARKMLNYMLAHFKNVSLEDMAAAFNYHPNTAAALLKKSTGKTFSELLLQIRMSRVVAELRQGKSVAEAAADCGYSNMSNFYRRFKQYYGKTPAALIKGDGTC